jgi:simple sugar transport system ATP-binding protein
VNREPAAAKAPHPPPAASTFGVETVGMTMRFGAFTALADVSIRVRPGSFHALLGENGAGKSTLVKCVMGYQRPTEGQVMVGDREVEIASPKAAHALGLGMVYQHFTLTPSLTAEENLVIAREDAPRVIDWRRERAALDAFMGRMPFRVPLDIPVGRLAAGERQRLEILKQLYLGRRFLILDEPTSVLTPAEADQALGFVKDLCRAGKLTALMITHKFREVDAFADEVSVLRRGRHAGGGPAREMSHGRMAALMVGADAPPRPAARADIAPGAAVLQIEGLRALDRSGLKPIAVDGLTVRAGEIVGVAGVSGNGQMELLEALAGQRPVEAGEIRVNGARWAARRREAKAHGVRFLPEEPLRNACAPAMSVAENVCFRRFDDGDGGRSRLWIGGGQFRREAAPLVAAFRVKTASLDAPIATLSGGNVQRAALARELSGEVRLLIVSNPCFGLDFSAAAEIRSRIVAARNGGAAVLLFSEDLDEVMELSDRVLVMSEGRVAYEAPAGEADSAEIGRRMAGKH